MTKQPEFGARTAIGSLTQLAAVGPQDIHIHYGEETKAHQFQKSYNQHTRFGIDITSVYDINTQFGSKFSFSIPFEKQHLISNITLKLDLPSICKNVPETCTDIVYKNKLGYRLIKHVSVKLNNTIIEQYSGQYMYILHQLETNESHKDGLHAMMAMHSCEDCLSGEAHTLYIPLILWYSRTMKQFFPQLALSKENLKIEIVFESLENLVYCVNDDAPVNVQIVTQSNGKIKIQCTTSNYVENISKTISGQFYIDYIALDHIERDLYLKSNQQHVYNLVLLQSESITTANAKIELHFNIPIKQLLFVIHKSHDDYEFLTFSDARLLFGQIGTDTMTNLGSDYYKLVQNHFHNFASSEDNIYSYSFALNSGYTEHNGAVHFGRLPTKVLEINGLPYPVSVSIYARGYNILHTNQGYGKVEFKA